MLASVLLVEALESKPLIPNFNSKNSSSQNKSPNFTMPSNKRSPSMDESYKENIVKNENLYSLIGVDNSGDKKTNIFNPPPPLILELDPIQTLMQGVPF